MDRKIIVTEDNSKTLLIPALNETYHSTHGAYNESKHVFIEAGLKNKAHLKALSVFEMGFGTGLNALLTAEHAILNQQKITFTTVEKFPLDQTLIRQLNYADFLQEPAHQNLFRQLHEAQWEEPVSLHAYFSLRKMATDINDLQINSFANSFNLIFYDAFAPAVQPELWSEKALQKMYDMLSTDGVLVTYCAQGQFKRNLKSVGFTLENLPGPTGKREMTRAIKGRHR